MSAFDSTAEYGTAESAPAPFSMSCDGGAYAITGGDASTGQPTSDAGSYSVFGVNAFLNFEATGVGPAADAGTAEYGTAEFPVDGGRILSADAGAYQLTGGRVAELLSADTGVYTLGGEAAEIAWSHDTGSYIIVGNATISIASVAAGTGNYDVFGNGAGLLLTVRDARPSGEAATAELGTAEFETYIDFSFAAGAGSYATAGQDIALAAFMASDTGAFAIVGGDANIAWGHDPGSYLLAGQPALLSVAIDAGHGEYDLTGGSAEIAWPHEGGSYAITGQPTALDGTFAVDAGAYAMALQDVFVGIPADTGTYVVSGTDAAFALTMSAQPGAFALTGQDANLLNVFNLYADTGAIVLSGQDAGQGYILGAAVGAYALLGDAAFASSYPVNAGAYVVTGQITSFDLAFKVASGQYTVLGWNVVDALGPTGDHTFLVEVQAHDGTSLRTLYLSTKSFTSLATDTPANTFYEPRISDPGNFERSLFSSGETRGRSSVGAGDIVIANAEDQNGETLDEWLPYGWDGREIRIKALPVGALSLSAAATLFVGRLDRLTSTRPLDQFSLRIADRLADLDKPLLTTLFAGTTTSTGDSAEGNADLKGKIKQVCFGDVKEVPLQPANPYDLIYLASNSAVQSIAVYDGGVALTGDGDNASVAALRAASISPGHYRTCLALGLVRLGGTPAYALSADVVEGSTSGARTAAQIAKRMLLAFGIPSNEIITGAFSALDVMNGAVCGYIVDDERTCLDAVQQMLDTVGGYMVPNRDGSLAVGRFSEPATGPGLYFDVDELSLGDSLDRVDGEIPVYRVTVQYARVNFVQSEGSLAGSVSAARRAYLANEWRTVVAEDLSVKTKHLNAREITVTCFFRDEADAQAEANRLLALYSVGRERYDVTMPLSDSWAADVGLALTLDHPRLGFAGGKAFNIIGRVDEYKDERVRFSLWG